MFGRGALVQDSAQVIHGTTGGKDELTRILHKTFALYGVKLLTFAAVAVIGLALGPALVGAGVLLYCAVWLYTSAQEAEYPPHWALVVALETTLLALAWAWVTALAEPAVAGWWPAPFGLRVDHVGRWWRVGFVLTAMGWLSVRRKAEFRLGVEITHPTFPPPLEARKGWRGPIDENTEFLPPPTPEVAVPETITRTVKQPVLVYQNGEQMGEIDTLADAEQPFVAPSGREVSNAVLRQFLRGSYRNNTAFIKTWKPRGWGYPQWKDTVDLLYTFGITSEVIERTKTRLLLPTQEEAMARLEQYLN